MTTLPDGSAGLVAFYRQYTKTWIHALATAALTGFGALAILHRWFVVLAVAAYVLPPIILYLDRSSEEGTTVEAATEGNETVGSPTDGTTGAASRRRERSEATAPKESSEATAPEEPLEDPEPEPQWSTADSPTNATLFDVVVADTDAYAVGADGIVLADHGDGWRTVLADGPGAASETLRGVDSTVDGEVVWFAGDGGTVARLDTTTDRHVDFTPPRGRTDTWEDVAVGGRSDDERILLVNGSGEVLRGRYQDEDPVWDEPLKPGGGSSLSGVALADASVGYVCDTNDGVFETTDGGETFRKVGIEGADGTLTDVATVAREDCTVSADDGVLHRHDNETWTPVRLDDEALEAVSLREERGVACGGGAVYERVAADADWERFVTSESGPLLGVSVGPIRTVAVGRDGAIVERT